MRIFAGPLDHDMQGSLNLYRVHYEGIHVVGTAGSIPEDMTDIISLVEKKKINAGALVSHILGLGAVKETLFAMEKPSGAKESQKKKPSSELGFLCFYRKNQSGLFTAPFPKTWQAARRPFAMR